MKQLFTHVALSVSKAEFNKQYIADVLDFYGSVFGWFEIEDLAIENERLILDVLGNDQYLNVRARDEPMTTSGYEHLGFSVENENDIRELYLRCEDYAGKDERVQLSVLEYRNGGSYVNFRVRFLLPLSIEVQFFKPVEAATR